MMAGPPEPYLRGIRLFNEGNYFEAHEVWESLWMAARGVEREFYQGLIQAAVALVHCQRRNPRGAVCLWGRCHGRLRQFPGLFMGIEARQLLADMDRLLRPWLRAGVLPPRGQLALDLAAAPRIRLVEQPTATLRIGLLTDAHCADKDPAASSYYRKSPARLVEAVIKLNQAGAQLLVQLGDLVDGTPSDIAAIDRAQTILNWMHCPVRHVLGNHDLANLSKRELLDRVGQREASCSLDYCGFHLVFLDSCFRADGVSYDAAPFAWSDADLPAPQRVWLANDLQATTLPAVIFLHHRLDAGPDDPHGLHSSPETRRILNATGKVRAVVQGHYHKGDRTRIDGIDYFTLAAVVDGFGENAFSILELDPRGGLRLHGFGRHALLER